MVTRLFLASGDDLAGVDEPLYQFLHGSRAIEFSLTNADQLQGLLTR